MKITIMPSKPSAVNKIYTEIAVKRICIDSRADRGVNVLMVSLDLGPSRKNTTAIIANKKMLKTKSITKV